MQRNYLEEERRGDVTAPATVTEAFQRALTQVQLGLTDRIDLVTFAKASPWGGRDLHAPLVKQISPPGVVFSDEQIKVGLDEFFSTLLGGMDGREELDKLASRQDEQTGRNSIVTEQATHVDRTHIYVDTIIWELPTKDGQVIGLSMEADDSGPLSWSYYIGLPHKERVGFNAFRRGIQHALSRVFHPIFDRDMLPPDRL